MRYMGEKSTGRGGGDKGERKGQGGVDEIYGRERKVQEGVDEIYGGERRVQGGVHEIRGEREKYREGWRRYRD